MEQLFEKLGIIVLRTPENIYTKEEMRAETQQGGKVVYIKWAYWSESFPEHHAGTLICEKPSLFTERKDILGSDDYSEIERNDIVFYAVKHLSVLIDYCRENGIDFVDCTIGAIEDVLDDFEFAAWSGEEDVQNIRDYIWGMSD